MRFETTGIRIYNHLFNNICVKLVSLDMARSDLMALGKNDVSVEVRKRKYEYSTG